MSLGHSVATALEKALEHRLTEPPSRAGARLKTVRQMARLVGVSHDTVHRSVERLVERGILTSKHGSGVYVRKVPVRLPPSPRGGVKQFAEKLGEIFADDPQPTRLRPDEQGVRLHFEMVMPDGPTSGSGLLLQRGLREQLAELGHDLKVVSAHADRRSAPRGALCDGQVVWLRPGFPLPAARTDVPVVYLVDGNADVEVQPLVEMNLDGALQRALRIFAKEGYLRIGLLGHSHRQRHAQAVYERVLTELGVDWRRFAFCLPKQADTARAVEKLMAGRDAPQAMYVDDDVVLGTALPVWRRLGFEPGRNLAVITHANHRSVLPAGYDWSRMEFDPYMVGRLAAQSLVREVESAGDDLVSFTHNAAWRPGRTHLINRANVGKQTAF